MNSKIYSIDPDFRPQPWITEGKGWHAKPRCCRCQKVIKNVDAAIRGTTDETGFTFQVDANGKQLLGSDCWKIVVDNNK